MIAVPIRTLVLPHRGIKYLARRVLPSGFWCRLHQLVTLWPWGSDLTSLDIAL